MCNLQGLGVEPDAALVVAGGLRMWCHGARPDPRAGAWATGRRYGAVSNGLSVPVGRRSRRYLPDAKPTALVTALGYGFVVNHDRRRFCGGIRCRGLWGAVAVIAERFGGRRG